MKNASLYELHVYEDPALPFLFHLDTMPSYNNDFLSHWHENIEILMVCKGEIIVRCDGDEVIGYKDDIIVINGNNVHYIQTKEESSEYYCLIIDRGFCKEHSLDVDDIIFNNLLQSPLVCQKLLQINKEFSEKRPLYKEVVRSFITEILVHMYREYSVSETSLMSKSKNEKKLMIKNAIQYIQENYEKSITMMDIASYVGLSKYYFCRLFKDYTGVTTVHYMNVYRCEKAKKLLKEGNYLVEEVAYQCGFQNLSYFTKTYKKYIGSLPSKVRNIK